jgi:hypothetical protein
MLRRTKELMQFLSFFSRHHFSRASNPEINLIQFQNQTAITTKFDNFNTGIFTPCTVFKREVAK